MKIRIGYGLGTRTVTNEADAFGSFVDDLERLGFDSLWLSERISGEAPDPLIALAYAAARTTKLKFGMSVLVRARPQPGAAGQGAGHASTGCRTAACCRRSAWALADPARAAGVRRRAGRPGQDLQRGAAAAAPASGPRTRSTTTAPASTTRASPCGPEPVQQPIDVWLGGIAPSEIKRVGRLGDGWLPSFCTADDVAAGHPGHQRDRRRARPGDRPRALRRPDRLRRRRRARRARRGSWPAADPTSTRPTSSPIGLPAVRVTIEKMIAAGASKFVLLPAVASRPPTAGPPSSSASPPSSSRSRTDRALDRRADRVAADLAVRRLTRGRQRTSGSGAWRARASGAQVGTGRRDRRWPGRRTLVVGRIADLEPRQHAVDQVADDRPGRPRPGSDGRGWTRRPAGRPGRPAAGAPPRRSRRTAARGRRARTAGGTRRAARGRRSATCRTRSRGGLGPLDALRPLLGQPVGHLGEHGPVEVLLRVEVAVHDEPGDAGLGGHVVHRGRRRTRRGRRRRPPPAGSGPGARRAAGAGAWWFRSHRHADPCQVYTQAFTVGHRPRHHRADGPARDPQRGHAMTTAQVTVHRDRAARRPRHRRAAGRQRRALPRRLRRGRHLRVAPHAQPLAGHRRVGGAAGRAVRHADPRHPARDVARELPQRRAVEVPDPQRRAPSRPSRRSPASAPSRASAACCGCCPSPTSSATLRRGHHRHRHRPPRHAACSRPTPATRPASRTRPATT